MRQIHDIPFDKIYFGHLACIENDLNLVDLPNRKSNQWRFFLEVNRHSSRYGIQVTLIIIFDDTVCIKH